MSSTMRFSLNLEQIQDQVKSQFTQLDPNDPSLWPALPRYALLAAVMVFVMVVLWFVWLAPNTNALLDAQNQEEKLRDDYRSKLAQAINLDVLKSQLEQVQKYVETLERQLPNKSEMDALLSDINQAGLGRSLQFELFRPGQVLLSDYYAELPIEVKVTGTYHDIGLFAADIAALSRIVTLNNISLTPSKDKEGVLTMECVAKTFRYLDKEEQAQRKAEADKRAGAKK
jgi:type IV pilus assembly protein PilO